MTSNDRVLVEQSGLFDADYYLLHNPDVAAAGDDPLDHFLLEGWRQLRRPRPDFDIWWYWTTYLDPADEGTNPFVHWLRHGRAEGLPGVPTSHETRVPAPLPPSPRRICLFASHDVDGVVDDHVIGYLRELSRHADVYFLSDGYLPPQELRKLESVTQGAWAVRHGAYDFGSYSMLARDLIGWEQVTSYDELLLVNDSCYLLRDLDEVFATMGAAACDWWGLQATKGLAKTKDSPSNAFTEPIPMSAVHDGLLAEFEKDPIYDFHVGSYFVAYRAPVLRDPRFRRILDSVAPQVGKLPVILKYEIGLTHFLVGGGYRFETYVDNLYPFHPLFTEWHFTLIERGFPLLKKYLLYQNHYDVPGLASWRDRVLALVPDAPIEVMQRDLERTAPDDRLRRSFSITRDADGAVHVPEIVTGKPFRRLARRAEVDPRTWIFPVAPDDHRLPPNSRAILEAVRHDPTITKVVLTRSRRVDFAAGPEVDVVPLLSPEGRTHLATAGQVFMRGDALRTLGERLTPDHHLHLIRDGLILGRAGRPVAPERRLERVPTSRWHSVLTVSDLDQLAVLATNYPAQYHQCWRTGIPAHDFLHAAADSLPADLLQQEERIRAALAGRRLLLVTPEHRGRDVPPLPLAPSDVEALHRWCVRHDVVIGVREHPLDLDRAVSRAFADVSWDLSVHRYPSTHAVLRAADMLVTDYSGSALDFAVTGRRVVSFAPDLPVMGSRLLFDLEHVFPGAVCHTIDEVIGALDVIDGPHPPADRPMALDLLTDRADTQNAQRVIDRIRRTSPVDTVPA